MRSIFLTGACGRRRSIHASIPVIGREQSPLISPEKLPFYLKWTNDTPDYESIVCKHIDREISRE
jgi:hypothetical protein